MPIRRRISDPKGFSNRVSALRSEKGFTLAQLGQAVGVSGTCVWNWEGGNTFPKAAALDALAKALGTSGTYLVEGDGDPPIGVVKAPASLSLQDIIQLARESISAAAGLHIAKVKVVLDYDS